MEASLPFNRIHVVDMNVAIEEASEASGEGTFVTLKNLRKSLPTDAWADLEDRQSNLCKVILSAEFGCEETDSDDPKINADYLKMWALLHCKGNNKEKAVAFYEILQEGGLSAHEQISATDKDFIPSFLKIVQFASCDVIKFSVEVLGEEKLYSDDEVKKLTDPETIVDIREDIWLEDVYGATARLANDAWLEACSKGGNWIFKPEELRKKIWEETKVEKKH